MLLASMEAAVVILEQGIRATETMATVMAVLESPTIETDAKGTFVISEALVHRRSIS